MRICQVVVRNFRGIRGLDWALGAEPLCCLVGPGDSAKTTVLDAVEAALSPRWITFTEADFHNADTQQEISIEVTLAELSRPLLSDERFGLFLRGLGANGTVHDEPEDDDEPILTIRLTIDATMEPVWSLICDRYPIPRILSNRDRALFGLVRLSGDEARHLTWAQGSVLSRLTDATDDAAQRLAQAYRTARASADLGSINELTAAASEAERRARELGAYVGDHYAPDLELGRGGFSSASIALHDGSVPLRLAGLGTRRLATLAIQRSSIQEGAIVLVDELEQGLEPHRILGAMSQMRQWQEEARATGRPQGQLLMTTHSDVTLSELPPSALFIIRKQQCGAFLILQASKGGDLSRILKHSPRAMFGRRILVCEGATELGLMLGLRELFPQRHEGIPIEHRGAAIVDGGGAAAPWLACALAWLGYPVAMYRDSDRTLEAKATNELARLGVRTIEYGHGLNTEQAIFRAASDEQIENLLEGAAQFVDEDTLVAQLRQALPGVPVDRPYPDWGDELGLEAEQHREAVSAVAIANNWFKTAERGRAIAPIVEAICLLNPDQPLAQCLNAVEQWLYA